MKIAYVCTCYREPEDDPGFALVNQIVFDNKPAAEKWLEENVAESRRDRGLPLKGAADEIRIGFERCQQIDGDPYRKDPVKVAHYSDDAWSFMVVEQPMFSA